jgi:MFS transporter, putative metabolite:H+ symporter
MIINKNNNYLLIVVAALGYFVDAYDLIVASVVRSSAIVDLGLAEIGTSDHKSYAQLFEYVQSAGILFGGFMFGVLGDKLGRKKVLYASIAIYSVANILNGFLTVDVPFVGTVYCILRFVCGFALAAELSVGIVMISETMPAKIRGYGSMIVVSFGILGAVLAAWLFQFAGVHWQSLFHIGGIAGILLLIFRYSVNETSHFLDKENQESKRGSLIMVLKDKRLLKIFLNAIMLGFPIYFFVSIPVKFATDYGKELGLTIKGTLPIIIFYIALSISDIVANYLSQIFRSRKKVLYFYIGLCTITVFLLHFHPPATPEQYIYIFSPFMGIASGYWALLITYTSEQVGTNIRSTYATAIPNVVRSLFIPIQLLLTALQPSFGTSTSVFYIGILTVVLAFWGLNSLKETWGKELNFTEK